MGKNFNKGSFNEDLPFPDQDDPDGLDETGHLSTWLIGAALCLVMTGFVVWLDYYMWSVRVEWVTFLSVDRHYVTAQDSRLGYVKMKLSPSKDRAVYPGDFCLVEHRGWEKWRFQRVIHNIVTCQGDEVSWN